MPGEPPSFRLKASLEDVAQVEETASRAAQVEMSSIPSLATDSRPSCEKDIQLMLKVVTSCIESINPHCDSIPGPKAHSALSVTSASLKQMCSDLDILISRLNNADSALLPLPTSPLREMQACIQSSLKAERKNPSRYDEIWW